MSKIAHISAQPQSEFSASVDPRSQTMLSAARTLIRGLPYEDQETLWRELTDIVKPIPAPRAGEVLGAVVRLLPKQRDWTVEDLKKDVKDQGVDASPKELYNAIGYLVRKGRIQRVGYGRYTVDGVEVVTSDDLGGANTRNEDEYRTNRD